MTRFMRNKFKYKAFGALSTGMLFMTLLETGYWSRTIFVVCTVVEVVWLVLLWLEAVLASPPVIFQCPADTMFLQRIFFSSSF